MLYGLRGSVLQAAHAVRELLAEEVDYVVVDGVVDGSGLSVHRLEPGDERQEEGGFGAPASEIRRVDRGDSKPDTEALTSATPPHNEDARQETFARHGEAPRGTFLKEVIMPCVE